MLVTGLADQFQLALFKDKLNRSHIDLEVKGQSWQLCPVRVAFLIFRLLSNQGEQYAENLRYRFIITRQ